MKIEDRAKQYGAVYSQALQRQTGFEHGASWLRDEVFIFLSANPKATVKQITEYLKTL